MQKTWPEINYEVQTELEYGDGTASHVIKHCVETLMCYNRFRINTISFEAHFSFDCRSETVSEFMAAKLDPGVYDKRERPVPSDGESDVIVFIDHSLITCSFSQPLLSWPQFCTRTV